jgi:hypothetical protein
VTVAALTVLAGRSAFSARAGRDELVTAAAPR